VSGQVRVTETGRRDKMALELAELIGRLRGELWLIAWEANRAGDDLHNAEAPRHVLRRIAERAERSHAESAAAFDRINRGGER
jgi:hypothetical protein